MPLLKTYSSFKAQLKCFLNETFVDFPPCTPGEMIIPSFELEGKEQISSEHGLWSLLPRFTGLLHYLLAVELCGKYLTLLYHIFLICKMAINSTYRVV